MSEKPKVLAAIVDLYERGLGILVIDLKYLSRVTGASLDQVEAVVRQLWSDDYLAYDGSSFRLTEQGYRKYLREVESGRDQ